MVQLRSMCLELIDDTIKTKWDGVSGPCRQVTDRDIMLSASSRSCPKFSYLLILSSSSCMHWRSWPLSSDSDDVASIILTPSVCICFTPPLLRRLFEKMEKLISEFYMLWLHWRQVETYPAVICEPSSQVLPELLSFVSSAWFMYSIIIILCLKISGGWGLLVHLELSKCFRWENGYYMCVWLDHRLIYWVFSGWIG